MVSMGCLLCGARSDALHCRGYSIPSLFVTSRPTLFLKVYSIDISKTAATTCVIPVWLAASPFRRWYPPRYRRHWHAVKRQIGRYRLASVAEQVVIVELARLISSREAMDTHRVGLSTEVDEYELFRRAIVERDEDAWATIYERYRSLLISWSRRGGATLLIEERCDDIADQAFARAWMALSPGRFAHFHNLSKLLAYLRTCVMAVVIDCSRAQMAHERALQKLETHAFATPEQIVLEEIERGDLWRLSSNLAETRQERIVLIESFVLELPPRVIMARHPDLFTKIANVYFAKRNLLARLQRNPDLQQLHEGLFSI
jgi:hypothetical protein